MKLKIQMKTPYYIIKPDVGIVVCKIQALSTIDSIFSAFSIYSPKIRKTLRRKYGITDISTPRVFTAITKLREGDTWDETLGKRIAESKCKRLIYKLYGQVYTDCLRIMLAEMQLLFNINSDLNRLSQHEEEYCKLLMQNEDNN